MASRKGSPNRINAPIKARVAAFLDANLPRMQAMWDGLESDKDRLDFIDKMLKHVLPKPLQIEGPEGQGISFTLKLTKPPDAAKE